MATTTRLSPLKRQGVFGANVVDRLFRWTTLVFAITIPVIIGVLVIILSWDAFPAIERFGGHFLTVSIWDPVKDHYGILYAIYGTAVSSLLALIFAVPISIGTAIFLAELAPQWLRGPVSYLIELLAAVPSIVYGLWGFFVLVPLIIPFEKWLSLHFGLVPFFQGTQFGLGMLSASVVLSIMILPYITSVSREVLMAVPHTQRDAALALGATKWETIRGPIFRYARSGIMGAIILGLGRALGETMAVTMVIGNRTDISTSIFAPGATLPSLLANEFVEATQKLHISALIEAALVLVFITFIINVLARVLIWKVADGGLLKVNE